MRFVNRTDVLTAPHNIPQSWSAASAKSVGGRARARNAFRDNFGRFLPAYGFFRWEDVAERVQEDLSMMRSKRLHFWLVFKLGNEIIREFKGSGKFPVVPKGGDFVYLGRAAQGRESRLVVSGS